MEKDLKRSLTYLRNPILMPKLKKVYPCIYSNSTIYIQYKQLMLLLQLLLVPAGTGVDVQLVLLLWLVLSLQLVPLL